jgi:hypothetical protein
MDLRRGLSIVLVVLCSCDPAERGDLAQGKNLQLVVTKDPIVLETDHTTVLELLVIGEGADEATISSPDLPPFATLKGSILTLSPTRAFQGDYSLTLVATAGTSTSSAKLQVTVIRFNSAPTLNGYTLFDSTGWIDTVYHPWPVTFYGTPVFGMHVADAEGDIVTAEMEVIPAGQVFSAVPTHAATAPVGTDTGVCVENYDAFHACIELELTGLTIGQRYMFAIRVRDSFGASTVWYGHQPTAARTAPSSSSPSRAAVYAVATAHWQR